MYLREQDASDTIASTSANWLGSTLEEWGGEVYSRGRSLDLEGWTWATRKREFWDTGIARHAFYSSFGPFEARRRTTVLADPIYFQGLFSLPQLRSMAVSEKNVNKERCVHVAAPVADARVHA